MDVNNPKVGGASFARVKWEHAADASASNKEDFVLKTRADVLIMKLRLSKLSTSTISDWLRGNLWLSMQKSMRNRSHVASTALGTPDAVIYENEQTIFGALSDFDTVDSGGERKAAHQKSRNAPIVGDEGGGLPVQEHDGDVYYISVSSIGSDDSGRKKTHRKSPSASSVNFAGVVASQRSDDSVADEFTHWVKDAPSLFKRESSRFFEKSNFASRLRSSIVTNTKAKRKQRREKLKARRRGSMERPSLSSVGGEDGVVGDSSVIGDMDKNTKRMERKTDSRERLPSLSSVGGKDGVVGDSSVVGDMDKKTKRMERKRDSRERLPSLSSVGGEDTVVGDSSSIGDV
jgi:hypothetical protein